MKRLIIAALFIFVATLLLAKLLEERNWPQSLFSAAFQTIVFLFTLKYFLRWWNKKSEEQRGKNENS